MMSFAVWAEWTVVGDGRKMVEHGYNGMKHGAEQSDLYRRPANTQPMPKPTAICTMASKAILRSRCVDLTCV